MRWAAFSCLLVPVVLVVYGTSYGGAAVATLGLVVVTAACTAMLRHSERARRAERAAAPVRAGDRPPAGHRRRHSRGGAVLGGPAGGPAGGGSRGAFGAGPGGPAHGECNAFETRSPQD
ncbi:hypothetical protein ACFWUQ_09460 [Streptomyces sp. NPDC058662]|uniref:hypothetical protein n=1 Tax=Streptomyces sp. NPDC058662 TaxID=3346583 RepID=UPI00365361C4